MADIWDGSTRADTIGLSSYPLDLHAVSAEAKPAFAALRHIYGVPFGSLVPRGFGNLILACPAISASHLAAGSARVIRTTVEEGEAAVARYGIGRRRHLSFTELARDRAAVERLRMDLARRGVILNEPVLAGARTAVPG